MAWEASDGLGRADTRSADARARRGADRRSARRAIAIPLTSAPREQVKNIYAPQDDVARALVALAGNGRSMRWARWKNSSGPTLRLRLSAQRTANAGPRSPQVTA